MRLNVSVGIFVRALHPNERLKVNVVSRFQIPCVVPHLPRKIKQVLVNLLSNAVKFTPEGGKIQVRAGLDNGAVKISISDTGIGIPADRLPHIFEEPGEYPDAPPGWQPLAADFFAGSVGQKLLAFLDERLAAGATIFPPQPLRALELTPPADVRVVILGGEVLPPELALSSRSASAIRVK